MGLALCARLSLNSLIVFREFREFKEFREFREGACVMRAVLAKLL